MDNIHKVFRVCISGENFIIEEDISIVENQKWNIEYIYIRSGSLFYPNK